MPCSYASCNSFKALATVKCVADWMLHQLHIYTVVCHKLCSIVHCILCSFTFKGSIATSAAAAEKVTAVSYILHMVYCVRSNDVVGVSRTTHALAAAWQMSLLL